MSLEMEQNDQFLSQNNLLGWHQITFVRPTNLV